MTAEGKVRSWSRNTEKGLVKTREKDQPTRATTEVLGNKPQKRNGKEFHMLQR